MYFFIVKAVHDIRFVHLETLFNGMYFVGEHWDHDASSSDVGDPERYHVPSAMRDFEDKDREAFLSNSGRDMKNILTKVKESEKKVQVNVPTYLCSDLFDETSSESFLFEKRFI